MKTYLRYFGVVVACLFTLSIQAEEKIADAIVGIIGDEIVLLSDVEIQAQQLVAQGTQAEDLECYVFDQLLLEKLFFVQAVNDSLFVSNDEIDQELEKRMNYMVSLFGSKDKLEEYYDQSIVELKSELRPDVEKQMMSERMRGSVLADLNVTPAEVRTFFENFPEDSLPYFNAEVAIKQLVIVPTVDDVQRAYTKTQAEELRQELVDGADFCLKALIASDDPGTKRDCGNLGFINRGEMVTEFEAAAFRLQPGEFSEVVETQFGFHIIECLEVKGERVKVRHILVSPELTSFDYARAEAKLDSIKTAIESGKITFEKAVTAFSEDEQSRASEGNLVNPATGNSTFEMDELEGDLAQLVTKMEVGDLSEIHRFQSYTGQEGLRIVKLVSETEAHKANLKQDYSKIAMAARQAKQQEVLQNWIERKRKSTYIKLAKTYDCPVLDKWRMQN